MWHEQQVYICDNHECDGTSVLQDSTRRELKRHYSECAVSPDVIPGWDLQLPTWHCRVALTGMSCHDGDQCCIIMDHTLQLCGLL